MMMTMMVLLVVFPNNIMHKCECVHHMLAGTETERDRESLCL